MTIDWTALSAIIALISLIMYIIVEWEKIVSRLGFIKIPSFKFIKISSWNIFNNFGIKRNKQINHTNNIDGAKASPPWVGLTFFVYPFLLVPTFFFFLFFGYFTITPLEGAITFGIVALLSSVLSIAILSIDDFRNWFKTIKIITGFLVIGVVSGWVIGYIGELLVKNLLNGHYGSAEFAFIWAGILFIITISVALFHDVIKKVESLLR